MKGEIFRGMSFLKKWNSKKSQIKEVTVLLEVSANQGNSDMMIT